MKYPTSHLEFSQYTYDGVVRKYKRQVGYPVVYHETALHNYFIPCLRKYNDQHNQCDIRPAHDEKVGCNTVEDATALLVLSGYKKLHRV